MSGEYKLHPVNVISHAQQKIAFLADAICSDNFEFSVTGQNGLYLLLRGLEDELKDAVNRLIEPSPEDARRTLKLRTEKKQGGGVDMRYRKISPHIWNDAKCREMSANGTLVFIFGLTHPALTSLGGMRATAEGLAAELSKKMSREAFAKAFDEGLFKGLFRYDEEACFLWFPKFLKYNKPESPNVVKGWKTAAELMPECKEKSLCLQGAKAFVDAMPKAFSEAFDKTLLKSMPYQEQEQEQDILKPVAAEKPPRRATAKNKIDPLKAADRQLFLNWFCYAFRESQGDRYRVEGAKDGKILKELLGRVPVKE